MQPGKGCEGFEGWLANGIEIGDKNVAVELVAECLYENGSKGFGFIGCKSCPHGIETIIGIGVEAMQ